MPNPNHQLLYTGVFDPSPIGVSGPQLENDPPNISVSISVDGVPITPPKKKGVEELADGNETMDIKTTKLSKIITYKAIPEFGEKRLEKATTNFLKALPSQVKDIFHEQKVFDTPLIARNGDTLIGVEIEIERVEGSLLHSSLNVAHIGILWELVRGVWSNTKDDSLRNNGAEFITHVGMPAKDLPKALSLLKMYLGAMYSKFELNHRCGTHIHVNVRDFTVEQFINLCMLYILFENTFYSVSGNRWKNIFCVPIRASTSCMEQVFNVVNKPRPTYQDFRSVFKYFKKYMAFNLLPAGKGTKAGQSALGTIEFRHHKGSLDPNELIPWVQMILDIHQLAQQVSFKELQKEIFELNTVSNYVQFAKRVFTHIPGRLSNQDIMDDMFEGSAFIKELYIMSKGS